MKLQRCLLLIAAVFVLNAFHSSHAQEGMQYAALSLVGQWQGELEYKDYSSGESVRILHRREITAAPDGSYITMALEYEDPGYTVYGFELMTVREQVVWSASTGRDGIVIEQLNATFFEPTEHGWTARFERQGLDADQPATLISQWIVTEHHLTVETQVHRPEAEPFVRNRVELERVE